MTGRDGGRGLYVDDSGGDLPAFITRPCGNGGTSASDPHPLVAPAIAFVIG